MEERELKGLTDGEAADLKARGLSNAVPRKCSKSYWDIIRDNVFTFFNALLAGIAVCFIVFGVGNFSKYGFCINLFLNTAIGIFQEVRSKKAVEKLSIVCEAKVPAIRSGREIKINSDDVVLGDLIVIEAGAQIPADGKVVSGSIEANESLLTGESDPIRKGIGGKLLAGSFAVSGRCVMEADAVGQGTYAAGIQSKAKGALVNRKCWSRSWQASSTSRSPQPSRFQSAPSRRCAPSAWTSWAPPRPPNWESLPSGCAAGPKAE
jgi:cation-transporting ATPase E